MAKNRYMPAVSVFVCLGLVCVHGLLCGIYPAQASYISYFFFVALSLGSAFLCLGRAMNCPPGLRRNWVMVAVALLVWTFATLLAARAQFVQHVSPTAVSIDDLLYLIFFVPLLLAIASPEDRQTIPIFFWLDAIQGLALVYLADIALFGALPFTAEARHPLSTSTLVYAFDIEHCALALFATGRLLVSPRRSAERRFFTILTGFLWVYALCSGIYDQIEITADDAGVWDALVDIPLMGIGLAALYIPDGMAGVYRKGRRFTSALIDNARPGLLGLAVVAVSVWIGTAKSHNRVAVAGIVGAFMLYGIRAAILQNRFSQTEAALEQARDRLEQLVLQDGLTGIPNRRCFDQRLRLEWARARRTGAPLSLLLIDIDHFKKLNDTHGHLKGDESLTQVARTLQKTLNRPGDLLARYGGEEFVALLPETDETGALSVAERLHKVLGHTKPVEELERQVTISIGGTTWTTQQARSTAEAMLDTADRALYLAKQNGRDRTEYLEPESQQA